MKIDISDFSVGVDTEEISRFKKYVDDPKNSFIKRIYTEKEIEYCYKDKKSAEHLAVRFCAKESAYKALSGLGVQGISLKDIEIENDANGVPFINFINKKLDGYASKVSLSHSKTSAVASVIVFKIN